MKKKYLLVCIKSFALKNILSGTDRKNQGELPTLVGALTLEAQPIAFGVGWVVHQLLTEEEFNEQFETL